MVRERASSISPEKQQRPSITENSRDTKIKLSQKERQINDLQEKLSINEKRMKDLQEQLEEQELKNDKLTAKTEILKDFLV